MMCCCKYKKTISAVRASTKKELWIPNWYSKALLLCRYFAFTVIMHFGSLVTLFMEAARVAALTLSKLRPP